MANASPLCHVFLSFKGETRNKFTCFLHDALKAEGFEVFMDKETIRVGDEVDSRIRKGIRDSMSAIVVFSENYAYSTWCLDELLLILERKKTSRYFIIPIFYEVEPADIRHHRRSFGAALEKHKERHPHKVDQWRHALAEVSNILGEHVQGMQNVFIKSIVKTFREKMSKEFPHVPLPSPITPPPQQGNNLATTSSNMNPNNKVILYTSGKEDPIGSSAILRMVLARYNVKYEERNCYKDPKYVRELEELVGNDNVNLPMVIINGKDVDGEEEVEGFDDIEGIQLKQKLKSALSIINTSRRSIESIVQMMANASNFHIRDNNSTTSTTTSFWDNYR